MWKPLMSEFFQIDLSTIYCLKKRLEILLHNFSYKNVENYCRIHLSKDTRKMVSIEKQQQNLF